SLRGGPSYEIQGLTDEQRERIGDFTIWDTKKGAVVAVDRDQVGKHANMDAAIEGKFHVKTLDGKTVEVQTVYELYREHLKDYDPDTVGEISGAEPELVKRLARDIWETTKAGHPVSVHH